MTIRARAQRLIPVLLTAAAVVVTASAADLYRAQARQRHELLQILEQSGLDERSPRLNSLVRSDPDIPAAKERIALALVADLLDPSTRSDAASPAELERRLEEQIDRLDIVEQLGHDVLATRPTSWRASTAIGAAIYLRRSLRRDEQLLRSYRDWEAPLLRARSIAPGRAEPARFLTMAYLELWPVLSEEKRELTLSLLAPSLTDPTTYMATIEAWLQVAGDDLEALDRLPQTAWLLNNVTGRLVQRGRLALALEAHRRWAVALDREGQAALDKAQTANARGAHTRAAKIAVAALVGLPARVEWLPLAERLAAAVPSGQLRNQQRFAHQWLDFELEQCLRSECRLSAEFVQRSLPMSSRGLRDQLVGALSVGNWEEMARREGELETVDRCSAPVERYWLAKASRAVREGAVRVARAALTECPTSSDGVQLAQARVLTAARRAGEGAVNPFAAVGSAALGTATKEGHEFAFPPGSYDLIVDFGPSNGPSLIDLSVDEELVSSVALPLTGGRRSVRIATDGAAHRLTAVASSGFVRPMRIVEFRRVDLEPAGR